MYRPGDIFYSEFTTNNLSGVATNTDITPWGTMVRNGIDDTSVSIFINNVDVGRYVVSGIIPNTYSKGHSVGVIISGYISSNLAKNYVSLGALDSKYIGDLVDLNGNVNANVVTVSGRLVAPGMSGSILSDLRFVNGIPAFSYQGIAQTGGNNYIRLAATESSINDYYKNQYINIVFGKGAYQQAIITSYSGSTKDAYVRTPYTSNQWLTVPDETSAYVLNGLADVNVISAIPGVTVSVTGQTTSTGNVYVTGIAPGLTVSVTGTVILGSGGLENIKIENNVNARQALSLISAVLAGSSTITGNNITYYAVNNNTITRVTSTAVSGARQAIVVFLP